MIDNFTINRINGTQLPMLWQTASANGTLNIDSVSTIVVKSSAYDEDSGLASCNLTLQASQNPTEAELVYEGRFMEEMLVDLTEFSIIKGVLYTLVLRIADKAGQISSVHSYFLVDDSPPIPGRALDGLGEIEVRCQGSVRWISLEWTPFMDLESTLIFYQVAVATSTKIAEPDVAKFGLTFDTPSADVELQEAQASSLRDGVPLYVTVKATNAAGLSSRAISGPLTVRCDTHLCQCPNFIMVL